MKKKASFLFPVFLVFFVASVLYVRSWIRVSTQYPSEQIHLRKVSPDGSKVALFSVKYQTIHPLVPSDVEPCTYLTVVDAATGRVAFRGTAYRRVLRDSFLALAEEHARWAVESVRSFDGMS
jgi:hypothetical protein